MPRPLAPVARSAIEAGRRLAVGLLLTGVFSSAFAAFAPTAARAQTAQPSRTEYFVHPPLLYQGSDPTADAFWPGGTRLARAPAMRLLPPVSAAADEVILPDASFLPGDLPAGSFVLPETKFTPPIAEWRVITDHKEGFFQKASATVTWLPRGGEADGFGITEFDLFGLFAVPFPNRDWPLLITPTFNPRYLDGPRAPDLPSELCEAFVDLVWLPKLSDRWSGIISVAPSYYGDFHVSTSEAWRLTGRGLARFDWTPDRLQLLFGVLYLNRKDICALPAGGVIWTPAPDRRYELVFPRPKLAHRISAANSFEDWLYLGAEFGGNSFAFEDDGLADYVTLRDYRVYVGLERKLDGGSGYRIEIGYVFSRSAEFTSGLPEYNAPDTVLLRLGAAY